MSDPYGTSPHNQPPQPNPYGGGGGYGAPQGGGGGGYGPPPGGGHPGGFQPEPKTDGVSIASIIASFLCCLAPVGVVLGILGLSRTKGGRRKGRGLAVAGIIIGIVMTLVSGAVVAAIVFFADSVVTPGNAEVGQCVNIDEEGDTILLRKKDCDEAHDGEIVGVAEVDSSNIDAVTDSMAEYCAEAIDGEDLARLSDHIGDIKAVIEDPDDVEVGDHLVCYVEPGDELTEPIL